MEPRGRQVSEKVPKSAILNRRREILSGPGDSISDYAATLRLKRLGKGFWETF